MTSSQSDKAHFIKGEDQFQLRWKDKAYRRSQGEPDS